MVSRMLTVGTAFATTGAVLLSACSASDATSLAAATSGDSAKKTSATAEQLASMPNRLSASQSASTPASGYPACTASPAASQDIICMYGTNTAQVFSEPNTLTSATYLTDPDTYSVDHLSNDNDPANPYYPACYATPGFPATFPGTGISAVYQACDEQNFNQPLVVWKYFSPPAPMPHGDRILFYGSEFYDGDGNLQNVAGCNQPVYTSCKVVSANGSGGRINMAYAITNSPLTVVLNNNLPAGNGNTLSLFGAPATTQLVLDPVATSTNATGIKAGDTGYFGGYSAIPTNAITNPTTPAGGVPNTGFAAIYKVSTSAKGTQAKGTKFLINAIIDSNSGLLDSASTCQAATPSSSDSAPTCSLNLIGAPGSPQTLVIDFNDSSS